MTDNLRDRIAAVQQAHTIRLDCNHPRHGDCRCGYKTGAQDRDGEDFDQPWWERHATHVADAVIAELGLKPELRRAVVCFPAKYFQGLENQT